jgi:alkaline phosphatase
MIKKTMTLFILIFLFMSGCAKKPLETTKDNQKKPIIKNVILMIGDGMGPQQVGLLLSYAKQGENIILKNRPTAFERIALKGGVGLSMTHAHNVLTTDSAASATQLATGKFAGNEMIGLDHEGRGVSTILEIAKKSGRSVGVVSDTRMTHATPAGFTAHQAHRSMENEIAVDIVNSNADLLLSGGWRHWLPRDAAIKNSPEYLAAKKRIPHATRIKSKRKDNRDLLAEAQKKGYTLVFDREGLKKAQGKILGLFSESGMQNGIKNSKSLHDKKRTEPTLTEMTDTALNRLSSNPKGFFLMVEGGQIDWAGHQNDAGWMLHEMLKFNNAINAVLDWMDGRDDTLLVVTADHETGGFGFSYSSSDLPKPEKLPGEYFKSIMYQPNFNFAAPEILTGLYNQKLVYSDLFKKFDKLPKASKTPAKLVELVKTYTGFPITHKEANRILEKEDNPNYKEGHYSLNKKRVTKMGANSAFYVYPKRHRGALLARIVSTRMGLVWATGTHTSTPVLVFSAGPKWATKSFKKIMHHTELAQNAIKALNADK